MPASHSPGSRGASFSRAAVSATENRCPCFTGRIFAGHLRSIIGSMTVEEILTERQKLGPPRVNV
jgi:hypothetical protein